jgi:DNA ligase-1
MKKPRLRLFLFGIITNMTKQDFQEVVQFIEEMKATSSTNDKKVILQKYDTPNLRKLFEYVYSPFKQYYVTSDNLKKRQDLNLDNDYELFDLLDDLNARLITGHNAIQVVNGFIAKNQEFSEVIYDVIDRNLKTRATTTLINSVLPGTVPTFDVALAEKFDGNEKKVNFDSGEWWASRKLDGVRCITVIDEHGEPKFYSRAGNEFLTLSVLAQDIKKLGLRNKVLDGEVCVLKEGGLEDFQGVIKEIGKKNHTIQMPKYYIFDFLEASEFWNQSGDVSLSARLIILNALVTDLTYAEPLPQFQIKSVEEFEKIAADATEMGYEGVMMRKDIGYEGKRSKNLLKVKKMHDAEYVVVGLDSDVNRIIDMGKEVEEVMLKAVIIEHKGNTVRVGSGFNIEQRRYYHENPNEIIGKTITVQFFEETTDQHGEHSLRFPVFKAVHGDKREF